MDTRIVPAIKKLSWKADTGNLTFYGYKPRPLFTRGLGFNLLF